MGNGFNPIHAIQQAEDAIIIALINKDLRSRMSKLVEIPKPHLRIGVEGEYADGSQYDLGGCLPALPGARMAYDILGKIEAPEGWMAHAGWTSCGAVSLSVYSPSVHLEGTLYGRQELFVSVTRENIEQFNARGKPGDVVRITSGKLVLGFTARYDTYYKGRLL